MAVTLPPPNLSGLAAIAGRGQGNLGIGGLGLQALQQVQAQQNARRQAQMEQMRLRQQGELGLRQLGLQRDRMMNQKYLQEQQQELARQGLLQRGRQADDMMAFRREQLGQQAGQFEAEMGLKERAMMAREQQQEMAKLLDEDKQSISDKGAFAAYAKMAMQQAKTPEEAQQVRNEILKEALANKYMTKAEANASKIMPLSRFKNALDYQIMKYDAVKNYKSMLEANQEKSSAPGISIEFDSEGNIKSFKQGLSKPVQTQVQKDIMFADDNINELMNVYTQVPNSFFGAPAVRQTVNWGREWAENVPLVGKMLGPSKDEKQELKKYSNLKGATEMMSMQIIKQLSGVQYSDKQLEFMKQILPSIGPKAVRSEYEGRVENLNRFFNQVKSARQKLLSQGMEVGSKEYEESMLNEMKNAAVSPNQEVAPAISAEQAAGLRQHLEGKGYSKEEIDAYMKSQGL